MIVNINDIVNIVKKIEKTETVTKYVTSYALKHYVERTLAIQTNNEINYVSNEEIIKAMDLAGFKCVPTYKGSINCHFNLSRRSMLEVFKLVI
jgi:hypothetical protein